jgi:hypothetical protein
MPATSSKQKKFMDAAAHNPSFAQQSGIPQSVAKDFSSASKGMKFGKGLKSRADLQRINKPDTKQGKNELFKKGGDTMASKMNPGFMAMMAKKKGAAPSAMGKPTMKKGMDMAKDGMKKMASGGMPMTMKDGQKVPAFAADGKGKMATGGSASKRADGVASKGKTQGKMLKKGGMAC